MTAPAPPLTPGMRIEDLGAIVPGPGLPADAVVMAANGHVDATWHEGSLFLVWRTAPTAAPSTRARVQVLASDDGGATWRLDYSVVAKRDLRDPRLVSWQGALLLYWSTGGAKGAPEPDRTWVTRREGPRAWRRPRAVTPSGSVAWRVRPVADRLAMTVTTTTGPSSQVELWASDDGWAWGPFDGEHPVVHRGGRCAELLSLPDGRLVAIVGRDPGAGGGADVVVTPADDVTRWVGRPDLRPLGSPSAFLDDGRPLLIARRSCVGISPDVVAALEDRVDVELPVPGDLRDTVARAAEGAAPTRATVHLVDPDERSLHPVGDLPATGATGSTATVPLGERDHLCFVVSAPPGPWPAAVGRRRSTAIGAMRLRVTR